MNTPCSSLPGCNGPSRFWVTNVRRQVYGSSRLSRIVHQMVNMRAAYDYVCLVHQDPARMICTRRNGSFWCNSEITDQCIGTLDGSSQNYAYHLVVESLPTTLVTLPVTLSAIRTSCSNICFRWSIAPSDYISPPVPLCVHRWSWH